MIADTLVIHGVIDTIRGQTATEAFVLYNPTPKEIDLNGYLVHTAREANFYTFASGDTIGAFGFIAVVDQTTGNTVDYRDLTAVDGATAGGTDTIALFLGSENASNVVDFWALGADGFYNGDKKETSTVTWNNNVWLFRQPAVMFNSLKSDVNDSPLLGGGGMINRLGLSDIFQDTRIPFSASLDTPVPPTRRLGWVDRMKFSCTAPVGSVPAGTDFTVYCTATVKFGKLAGSNWEGTDYPDSTATAYTGSLAFGDFTVSAGTINGITGTETEFTSGKMNGNSGANMNITGMTGQAVLTLSDAYCTGYTTIEITAQGDTIKFDVAASQETHDTGTSAFTITGKSSGDSQAGANWDSVVIIFDGVDTQKVLQTDTGTWSCTGNYTFKDNGGVQVVAYLYRNGVQAANDTITVVYDGTQPKITAIADTGTVSGTTYNNSDRTALFYIVDTGAGFSSSSGCTLHYQQIGGSINDTAQMTENNASGTWTVSATLPFSLVTAADTQWKFWVRCSDDAGNNSLASGLSPPYTVNNNGTATINVLGVRDVVISEIMWGGNDSEYIELYNTTSSDISLSGWTLSDDTQAAGGGTGFKITFGAGDTIPAYGYFLLLQGSGGTGEYGVNDMVGPGGAAVTGIDTAELDAFSDNDLSTNGDSIVLTNSTGAQIDSAPFDAGWPAGSNLTTPTDNKKISMERKLTGVTFSTAGYGGSSSEWDTNTKRYGHHGRPHGTPGHPNSVNIPNITAVSPQTAVMEGGRGKWTITVTNGPQAFSSGRIILQMPAQWSKPGNTASDSGYTTVSVSNGSVSSTSYDGQSVTVNLSSWTATTGVLTVTYGDVDASDNRNSIAKVQSNSNGTPALFQLLYDVDGTSVVQAGDSGKVNMGAMADTLWVVDLGGATMDTNPASNPRSFFGSEYELTFTFSDSWGGRIYGAHDSVSIRPLGTNSVADDSHLHEYSAFDGFYDPSANDSTEVGGWTNSSGEFKVTAHLSSISANDAQLNQFRVTDADKRALGTTLTYSDSARLPVPVINEVAWDGTGASEEFIEIYNPTHEVQNIEGYRIISVKGLSDSSTAAVEVPASAFNTVFSINPFHYLVLTDAIDVVQDSGGLTTDSRLIDVMTLNEGPPGETLVLQNGAGSFTDAMGVLLVGGGLDGGYFNSNTSGNPSPINSSLERVFPNRIGTDSSNWSQSDSTIQYPTVGAGRGSPGRPNATSLYKTEVDNLDTYLKASDTARITLVLKIASGDTQPNQQIGCTAVADFFPLHGDSSLIVLFAATTNSYGTAWIQVYPSAGNTSGTVTLKVRQPYGIKDSAVFVFDKGESLVYVFQSSETNIFDTSPTNALLVYVGFGDTISGLDSTIVPALRWRIGTSGSYSSYADMKLFSGDTYLARIDISSSTWAIKQHDTIFWQVTWRDRAGNWDTSPENYSRSREFIDNTIARDTIISPTDADTLSGTSALIRLRIYDQATDYCTLTIKYDTYGSKKWTNATLSGGSADSTSIASSTGGTDYDYYWNTNTDLGTDSTISSVRLLITVYDGYDTHYDTGGFFGVTNNSANDRPYDTILYPVDADTYGGQVTIQFVLIDPDSDICTAVIQYSRDSGTTWKNLTLTDTSDTSELYAPTFGDTKLVVWRSKSDIPDTRFSSFRVRVYAIDSPGLTGPADTTANFGIDNQKPPLIPQCTAEADVTAPDSGVYVFWAHAPLDTDVKGYRVFRSSKIDSANAVQATSSLLTDTTGFKDLGVVQGDTWYYHVVAVDTYGNFSDSSMQVEAPYVEVTKIKDPTDSSNFNKLRPGDTLAFRLNVRNVGFAPARGVVLYDYVPQFGTFTDSATASSVESSWTIEYRVSGAGGVDLWQSRFTDTATIVRFTRGNRMDPKDVTSSDTLKIKVKIE